MSYIDIYNSWSGRGRHYTLEQTNWSVKNSPPTYNHRVTRWHSAASVPGIDPDSDGWTYGAAGMYSHTTHYHTSSGPRILSFLIKIDPAVATGGIALLNYFSSTAQSTTYDNVYYDIDNRSLRVGSATSPSSNVIHSLDMADDRWHHIAFVPRGDVITSAGQYFGIWDLQVDGEHIEGPPGLTGGVFDAGGNNITSYRFNVPIGVSSSPLHPGVAFDHFTMFFDNNPPLDEQVAYVKSTWGESFEESFEESAEVIDITAEMLSADVEAIYNSPHRNIAPTAALADLSIVQPDVIAERSIEVPVGVAVANGGMTSARVPYAVRLLSPLAEVAGDLEDNKARISEGPTGWYRDLVRNSWSTPPAVARWYIKVPVADLEPGDVTHSLNLRLSALDQSYSNNHNIPIWIGVVSNKGETYQKLTYMALYQTNEQDETLIDFDVPAGAEWLFIQAQGTGWNLRIDSPDHDYTTNPDHSANASFFTAYVLPAPVVEVKAQVAEATAMAMPADAQGQQGALHLAEIAVGEADMPGGVFPDANTTADLMTGSALMGAAWFKSDRNVTVEAFDGTAEALDIELVTVTSNIYVNAPVAIMEAGEIIDPEEVDNTTSDPYWNRVTGRRDVGQNVRRDAGDTWLRFNERRGDPRLTSTVSGVRSDGPVGALTGAYRWGATAPNGKRGLRVENAGLDASRDDNWPFGGSTGSSYEFTIKVAPGHTGRMDILNGSMRHTGEGISRTYSSHVSIRDGHIFVESRKYGTSLSRIDDNRWHHVVITPGPRDASPNPVQNTQWPLDIYIDGKLDRRLTFNENQWHLGSGDPRAMVRPDHYFGQDTGFPFRGEITDFVFRWTTLNSNQVMELYLDMFGFQAVRPVAARATAEMLDGKVESNMKRMLVLSFGDFHLNAGAGNGIINGTNSEFEQASKGIFVNEANPVAYTPIMERGFGKDTDVGNYRLSYQNVRYSISNDPAFEKSGHRVQYRNHFMDEQTGATRLINLQEDVNLDDFDVIFVQGYRNPPLNDQATRLMYEAFLRSLNQALVDGHKFWMTDPYLAADLGWVSDVDIVPVFRGTGNDVRAVDVVPFPQLHGVAEQPYPRPANGAMPKLPIGLPMGSGWGPQNIWSWDMYHNNGYRVVNEVDGLTTLPSWETVEHFIRDQTTMFPTHIGQIRQKGYKLENRSGEDYEWTFTDPETGQVYTMSKPSAAQGLRAGDEFYDYTWTEGGFKWYYPGADASWGQLRNRVRATWAIPQGALKVGTPIATFRSTLHDDFGREVPNPYRNHVRNAVVRPGDNLPDGQKVKGYVYMDFAMRPTLNALAGWGVKKQLTTPPGIVTTNTPGVAPETEQSFSWDSVILGRSTESSRGAIEVVYFNVTQKPGAGSTYRVVRESWPAATFAYDYYPVDYVPHLPWHSRGLAWLLAVDKVDTEYAAYSPQAATATASMGTVQVDTEFETEVNVGPASAVANIMAPAEAQVRSASVTAWAATATGLMTGLMGGYSAEPAQAFASMPENVQRPQDIEEVLFFTVTMSQNTITLRMEEN